MSSPAAASDTMTGPPMDAFQMAAAVRDGERTAVELAEDAFARVGDDRWNAFLDLDRDDVLRRAEAVDQRRARGESLGPLAGVPVAVKDNMAVRGRPMTCASRILDGFTPPYDAHVVERLEAADAVCFGKTNMDEFAMGASGENSAFGATGNPWDLDRSPGGSSSGSAAIVGSRAVPLALGSDTGGSIRQPAALCGCVGMKPSYGRVSRYGIVAFASSLDQVGPFAGSLGDAALLLQTLAGHDPRDSTSVDTPVPDYTAGLSQDVRGWRVGIVEGFGLDGLDAGVTGGLAAAADVFHEAGASVQTIRLENVNQAVAVYYVVAPSEASSNLARFDGIHYGQRVDDPQSLEDLYMRSRGEGFGPEVKRRIMVGTYALSSGYYDAYYKTALKVRRLIAQDFDRAFGRFDLLLSPVTPHPAFALNQPQENSLSMYLDDIFSIGANLAGLPAMSAPVGFAEDHGGTQRLPVGVQIIGPRFEEARVLRGGRVIEDAFGIIPPPA